ncbi:MAG: hypothetical protein IT514_11185 [Burkholderiales bacterium]|nr:hypothetical protein [Burkholderiales bacterium]
MKRIVRPAVLFLLGAMALPAAAQTATPGIDRREARQERRIEQGEKSGQLTRREAARLEKGQARIDRMQDKARADGKVTAGERARIHRAQNTESRRIARQKHDKQVAGK